MMKLIGEYFGFDGVSFQIIVINSYIVPPCFPKSYQGTI